MNRIVKTSYPLSYGQEAMWFIYQIAPESVAYNIFITVKINSYLNIAAVNRVWETIIEHHPILRTTYTSHKGKPVQQVNQQQKFNLEVIDASNWSEDYLKEKIFAIADRPFNLEKDAVLRVNLFTLSVKEHVLLLTMHHIAGDMWSYDLLLSQFQALYAKEIEQVSQEQTEAAADSLTKNKSYLEFVRWQSEMLSSPKGEKLWQYWQEQLAGDLPILNLLADKPRPTVQTYQGAGYILKLDEQLIQKLKHLALASGTSLYQILLAAFYIQLYRYTNQTDILIGSPMRGRWGREFKEIVGYFVNLIVLRTSVQENATFKEFLAQISKTVRKAQKHQDYPFSLLAEQLQLQRDPSRSPLCQVSFTWQAQSWCEPTENSLHSGEQVLQMEPYLLGQRGADFDLNLAVMEAQGVFQLCWQYNTDLFEATTIRRMAGHFVSLLEGIVANPQEQIWQLPLLTEVEQQQLLVEWNDTGVDYPQDKCIHKLFEEQVGRTPNALAVVFENQQLTYQQLNYRANQLAHYLQSLGVGADVLVGLCVERSLEMVIGLLGILKAGGAYVPLDPEYPTERLRFMLEDAQVSVLLTQQHLVERLPKHQAQLVYLDTDWQQISQSSQLDLVNSTVRENLAYVIYTSGSTGQPKGVMIQHNSLVNFTQAIAAEFGLSSRDRVLQFASISFDVAAEEIYPCLTCGATLVLRTDKMLNSMHTFLQNCQDWDLTVLDLPTAYWYQLTLELASAKLLLPDSIRLVIIGGEPLLKQQLKMWQQHISQYPQLINAYGPTETTVEATLCKLHSSATTEIDQQKIVIGRPIHNTQIYILDTYLQPVPIGVPGELHIGGASLARGYLNRPELTHERFITNPFGSGRLYKTGDSARYLNDGSIEYLERIDNQVKIRGFRIELGEIESRLSQYDNVQACCAIAREDTPGDKHLVAYVVPQQGFAPTISQLRSFLSGQLPQYMMPHAFVMLESLPLTSNGKVDRRSLPAPQSCEELKVSFVAPRTQIEQTLAQIWAKVLRLKQVGIHDNFFELGGDSILSIQIISRAKKVGLQLTLKQLFGHQTIAQLATVAGTIKTIEAEQGLVTGTLPLTPIQHWFFEQNLQQPHHYNQSFLLCVPSDLKPELLKQVLQQLLVHHDALRLRFTQSDYTWQQIHSAVTDSVPFSDIDLSALKESEQKVAIEAKAASFQGSLNLYENLVQVAFFRLGIDKKARLLIVIHHLVVDGVSWRILLEDLQTTYQQVAQGKAMPTAVNYALPVKTTSFKDWSYKLTEYAQSQALKSEVAYWLNESRAAVPPLPVDYTQGANTVASASTVSVSLNEAQTRALVQDVPKAYNTQINDVLLTALVLVLAKWTNSNCVLFNLEGHGREDIVDGVDLSRTISWFTTIFPVLVELQTTENPADALKSVKEQLRAIPNKGIGYGLLRYLSQDAEIATQLQAFPQPEISFNYLGQFDQLLNISSWMQPASESAGLSHGLQNNRSHLLEIDSIITGERLQIEWVYSKNVHQHATIESLAQEFVKILQRLIAHCSSGESGGYTPSDFPLVRLNQLKLDQLLTSLIFKNQSGKTKSRDIEDIYPLSPMQQGMLFESLYAPDSGVYFEQLSCTLSGKLNVAAFEQAWQQVVARHSILRTAFVWEQLAQPLQIVYRQVDVNLQTHDWRSLSAQQQQQQLELFLQSQRQQGFQLSQAPLMHLGLIQLSADSYQFIWSFHHLLLDGWSVPLIFKDLLYFYQTISQGETKTVQPTQSYRNYIAWLQKQDLTQAEQFWREKLQGFIAPTPLNVDKKPSSNRKQLDYNYSEQQVQLTVQATAAVQTFARGHQQTMNNLVQGTWALLLCRYSQETDVVFGATVSGRSPSLVGIESMVGLLINTLPVRVQVSPDTQVLDLLKDLQAQQVESEQYSYSSLVEIQGLSEVKRGTPLFESIVVFENYPIDEAVRSPAVGLLSDTLREPPSHNYSFSIDKIHSFEQTNYPLTVVAIPGEQLLVKISYDTSRFDDATITRMLGHFQTLLEGIVANPIQRISQLPLLTEVEQRKLLVEWNDTQTEYLRDKCIHQLFEEQVQRTPDAVAVVFENQQLTYQQLNTQANQLAHYLKSLGVRADVLVGICVERSPLMLVGLLGILKAGGAYVPLDPEYPQERLSFMLEDTQVKVLLTQQQLLESLPQHQACVVCLDTDLQSINQANQDNLNSTVSSENLSYVIYTSGSTGKPKGVAVTHQAVNRLVLNTNYIQLAPSDSVAQAANIAFDAATFEIWGALLHGGKLVIIPQSVLLSPQEFAVNIRSQEVSVLFLTTALFNQLASFVPEAFSSLRYLLFGGEAVDPRWVQEVLEKGAPQQLLHVYGPTENTTFSSWYLVEDLPTTATTISIGRAISNTQIYILDKYLQPVPVGVPGELHIGGAGLARGYLNRPELTNEKFIPNPFEDSAALASPRASAGGSRLYKTGDQARYLSDGNIEYLGRIDNQVKIRGFRIELGEIEAVLSHHPLLQGSAVVAREDTPGDKRLVAYLVPALHSQTLPQQVAQWQSEYVSDWQTLYEQKLVPQIREYIQQKLPDYMVPQAFVLLDALPLTPNGKVDRRSLPAPDTATRNLSIGFVLPRTPIEAQLAQIWSEVLGVERIGVKDNFFELGGHSLLATQVLSEINSAFGLDLSIQMMFESPTVAGIASYMKVMDWATQDLLVKEASSEVVEL